MSTIAVVNRTARYLAELPDDQLAGPSPLMDALDTLTDAQLVALGTATKATAASEDVSDETKAKAARVLKAAASVAKGREDARTALAAARPYPGVFAASKAGEKVTAITARRVRLGTETLANAANPSPTAAANPTNRTTPAGRSNEPIRRPTGPLKYYNLWVAQGRWGRSGGSDPLGGLAGFSVAGNGPAAGPGPADPIEAAILGARDPMRMFGLAGVRGLAGLNLGKFFSNLVGDIAPIVGLAAPLVSMIPGVGTAVGAAISTVTNTIGQVASAGQQPTGIVAQQTGAPVYGPAPMPQQQASTSGGMPPWGWAAIAGAAALLLARR